MFHLSCLYCICVFICHGAEVTHGDETSHMMWHSLRRTRLLQSHNMAMHIIGRPKTQCELTNSIFKKSRNQLRQAAEGKNTSSSPNGTAEIDGETWVSSPRTEASATLVGAAPPVYTHGEAGPFCSAHGLGWDVAVTSLPCSVLSQLESSSLLRSHLPSCHCSNAGLLWIHSLHWQEEV